MENCTYYISSNYEQDNEIVKRALELIGIFNRTILKYNSGSPEKGQIVGMDKIVEFASNRVKGLCSSIDKLHPNKDAVCIGIEAGIIMTSYTTFDLAIVAVDVRGYGYFYSTSNGIVMPIEFVEKASEIGFGNTTVASQLGGDPSNPHATLTGNVINRTDTLIEAVRIAFIQARHAVLKKIIQNT